MMDIFIYFSGLEISTCQQIIDIVKKYLPFSEKVKFHFYPYSIEGRRNVNMILEEFEGKFNGRVVVISNEKVYMDKNNRSLAIGLTSVPWCDDKSSVSFVYFLENAEISGKIVAHEIADGLFEGHRDLGFKHCKNRECIMYSYGGEKYGYSEKFISKMVRGIKNEKGFCKKCRQMYEYAFSLTYAIPHFFKSLE
jgi:predicted Zn-dependent protease